MIHEEVMDSEDTNRPTVVEIDTGAITHNFEQIQKMVKCPKVLYILKANAYGHGLLRIAQHLENLGAAYFGVAYLEEGILLRKAGITTPILVLGGIIGNQIPFFLQYDLTITASSIDKLHQIDTTAAQMKIQAKVHLKIDTGMERIGIHYYSAEKLLEESLNVQNCTIEGIYSHLANADEEENTYSRVQIRRFKRVLKFYKDRNIPRPLVHLGNSAGTLKYEEVHFDMVRVGLLLYGVYPSAELKSEILIIPALSWKTRVVYFKVIQANHPVSYGGTWQSKTQTRLVTLPVGYGDGYFRAMSNKAHVIINGNKYSNVGNICMDQMMVNIHWDSAYNGDEVILIGSQSGQSITVEDLAGWAGTIPYEILTNINTRVPRVYI
jgi:alanine racemase